MSQQLPKATFGADWANRSTPGPFELAGHSLPSGPSPSLTYEPHYGLKEKAFSLSADPRFLYRSPAHAPAFEELLDGHPPPRRAHRPDRRDRHGQDDADSIGAAASRSTDVHRVRARSVRIARRPAEDAARGLRRRVARDLKRGSLSGASRPDLSYPLYEFLDSLVPLQAFAVVIIDEAQNLPLTLLEEIRILSDLEQREKLLQVVLVGQPELKSHLKHAADAPGRSARLGPLRADRARVDRCWQVRPPSARYRERGRQPRSVLRQRDHDDLQGVGRCPAGDQPDLRSCVAARSSHTRDAHRAHADPRSRHVARDRITRARRDRRANRDTRREARRGPLRDEAGLR